MTNDQRNILTRAGYEALQQQLVDYQQRLAVHMENLENMQYGADEQFDEDGAEFDVRTRREFLEERIGNLELILREAEIIDEDPNPHTVDPGDRVTVWNAVEKQTFVYDLIGSSEVIYGREGVSIESPVGAALIGKRVGDVVEVETPDGMDRYVIRSIERSPEAT